MRILKTWLRLLLGSNRQQPARRNLQRDVHGASCFEAWICAYRRRLDNDRGRHQGS
jgi:hypothetical protein